ncbi:hypothetical protein POTOM_000938 [Populus tomentosa]|uniref:EF-hand domain-containing protein n=1 Tax=Populus tomentosa TaxID=118781 RepID=A0A8X8DGZ3_POPTO|nr:hypothetical protein POTOM_000938 [Populus tomentosa]
MLYSSSILTSGSSPSSAPTFYSSPQSAAMKDAEKLIRDLDSNGDRYVDFVDLDEFMEAIIECGSKEGELMDAFLIFDIDKNGFISAKELQRY